MANAHKLYFKHNISSAFSSFEPLDICSPFDTTLKCNKQIDCNFFQEEWGQTIWRPHTGKQTIHICVPNTWVRRRSQVVQLAKEQTTSWGRLKGSTRDVVIRDSESRQTEVGYVLEIQTHNVESAPQWRRSQTTTAFNSPIAVVEECLQLARCESNSFATRALILHLWNVYSSIVLLDHTIRPTSINYTIVCRRFFLFLFNETAISI